MTTYTAIPDADIDTDSPITQSLMTLMRDNPIAVTEGATGAPRIVRGAIAAGVGHRWFFDYGDESDGAITHSASTTIAPGLWQCTTFQIDATYTVGLNAMGPLIICATTSITINGTLDVDGDGARGGDGDLTAGNYGQAGMFGGTGGATTTKDGGPTYFTAGGTASVGNGNSQSTRALNTLLSLMPIFSVTRKLTATEFHEYNGESSADAAVGGGGGAGSGNNSNGGNGGGLVVLCAPVITVGAAGVITADGGSATYGGGGGGGAIIVATPSGGYTNSGSVAAAGGNSTNAGNGGTGIAPTGSTPTVTLT